SAVGFLAFCTMAYCWTRWMFAFVLVIDQRMDAGKALATSWRMTRDKFLPLFGFNILRWLVLMAGPIIGFVGGLVIAVDITNPAPIFLGLGAGSLVGLFTGPFYLLAFGAAYVGATGQTDDGRRFRGDDIDYAPRGDYGRDEGRRDLPPRY